MDCPLCNAHFLTRSGYGRHRGSQKCRNQQLLLQLPRRVPEAIVGPIIQAQPPVRPVQRPSVYAAIRRDNTSPEEEDDDVYSVISDFEISRYPVPEGLLDMNENDVSREDGRHQKLVDFVHDIMMERQPPRYRQWIARILFYFFAILDKGSRLAVLFYFFTAMLYCQAELCNSYFYHFYAPSPTDKV